MTLDLAWTSICLPLEGVACFARFDVMVDGSQVVKEGLFITSPASDVRSSTGTRLHGKGGGFKCFLFSAPTNWN